jgi:hypothetical protein
MANVYNLSISHSWSYADDYDRLANLLNHRGYFPFVDYSIPRDDPIHTRGSDAALYQAVRNKMTPCHVVVILAGVYANYSKWIDKEIGTALAGFTRSKPILAIKPRGNTNVSTAVSGVADKVVAWNTESVVGAIREMSL